LTVDPEQADAFRAEVRDWLAAHVPAQPLPSVDTAAGFAAHRAWERELAAARLSVVSWPPAYGGRGASLLDWLVFEEEYHAAAAPVRVGQNGLFLLAPTLFAHGTAEQRDRLLPPMARADEVWAQAWSEPDAGSDLASIRATATRVKGDSEEGMGRRAGGGGAAHPWLSQATELLWSRIDALADVGPYDMRALFWFLDNVPDRDRARAAMEKIGPMIFDAGMVALDPETPGEVHYPLDFAPLPGSLARGLFDQRVIDAGLDHLATAQQPDGGWTFNWMAWSPAAEREWRGVKTVEALHILRAHGRC